MHGDGECSNPQKLNANQDYNIKHRIEMKRARRINILKALNQCAELRMHNYIGYLLKYNIGIDAL